MKEHSEQKRIIGRRNFIWQSGVLLSASALELSALSRPHPNRYKMGLQLFTVREAMATDLPGTLKKIASLGYEDLETYGFDGEKLSYYGLKAAEFRKQLEDHQLTTSSGHYDLFRFVDKPMDSLRRYVDQCIEGAHQLGQRYITWPWLDPDSRTLDKFKIVAERLNVIGEQINKAGLGLAYHNHDFEFIEHNGQIGYDIIIRDTDPKLVKLQMDLYWVMHSSKLSPHEWFSKQPGRFIMWHVKDMDKVTRDYTELGNGSIDYTKILPDASLAGMEYYFLEQGGNFAGNPLQSITDSAAYFKKHLQQYLK